MAFCEKCGNKLNEGAKFCGKCGTPVVSEQDENISAPAACTQCGASLEEGEMFCPNCGAKVGAMPQYQPAPIQTQGQAVGGGVLKEGRFTLNHSILSGKQNEEGILLLYRDRLEWKGETYMLIPIEKITSVELQMSSMFLPSMIIKMVNKKYLFYLTNTEINNEFEKNMKRKELEKNHELVEKFNLEAESWRDAINSVRNGTL